MESAEQRDKDFQQKIHGHLRQSGHKVAPESLNPNDRAPIERINRELRDMGYGFATGFGETIGPEVSYDRTTKGRSWRSIISQRLFKKAA